MQILGDMEQYTRFEAAESLRERRPTAAAWPARAPGWGPGWPWGRRWARRWRPRRPPAADPIAAIDRLGELFKRGILTQAEFDAKKAELLQQIR